MARGWLQKGVRMPLVLALLLAASLAGCSRSDPSAGSTEDAPAGETTAPPTTGEVPTPGSAARPTSPTAPDDGALRRLTLDDCVNFGGVFPVPMDAARAALPPGFEPVPAAATTDPTGGATMYVLGLRCAGSTVDGVDTGSVDLAYAELAVVPPADAAVDGRSDCTVPLVFVASVPAVGQALADLRLGVAGAGDVGWAEHTGVADLIVAADLGGVSFTLRGAYSPAPPTDLGSGDFVLYGVQDGQLRSTVLASAQGGAAVDAPVTLEAAGDDVLAQARPATRGFSVGGFSLEFQQTPPPQTP